MDPFIFIIGLFLIFTGAAFIGYPLGKIIGKREAKKEIAAENFAAIAAEELGKTPTVVFAAQKRLDEKDVLNAETIEEFECWDEIISPSPEAK